MEVLVSAGGTALRREAHPFAFGFDMTARTIAERQRESRKVDLLPGR